MKVAKTKTELSQIRDRLKKLPPIKGKNIDQEMNEWYEEIPDKPSKEYLEKRGFREWKSSPVPPGYNGARARYEAFVAGFLFYFENHVKESEKIDRTLYFDWHKINKNDNAVTIYLQPFFGIPLITEPVKTDSDMNTNGNGKSNGAVNKQTELGLLTNEPEGKMLKTAIASPPSATPVDPPPPPPPPPPPRE